MPGVKEDSSGPVFKNTFELPPISSPRSDDYASLTLKRLKAYEEMDNTQLSLGKLRLDPPKPKAKHDLEGVNPLYLQTACYRPVPGMGMMYDWKTQHYLNLRLNKQKNSQIRAQDVMLAAKKQILTREKNRETFSMWLEEKKAQRFQEKEAIQRIKVAADIYPTLLREDGETKRIREKRWVGNFQVTRRTTFEDTIKDDNFE
mmetsp:Transcript_304/g.334  ORF Transcript_304/g.334 Transcript_304/m.334 type:complete len:202 (-) Transcript_304:1119-1724(-)|eukprot:CAMPEP_0175043140 /NCGR_PEP_ID=MMETSP0052_2-20121109/2997_1 /TAXON_ID=51329 ORGANISM="Polytomella parva, Strain SAG 63-3" /NCGR_SAMPLE_ID=MMETSP0052_2 /ASSEMBLY_ACC=CAM_ASM_000194 /LENGTH=201 /DNA_ID=CAMNT_0016306117 /DNA_START=192 /DNA_END=797 /DNA_ORIENTATION=+